MGVLTEKGFRRPSYEEILEGQIKITKDLFGEDIETSEQTILGKFIRIICKDLAEIYEDLEGAYYARFPNTASGASLDRLCVFAGISRNPPTAAVHKIKVYGTPGYIVPVGFLVGTENGINFYNVYKTAVESSETDEITVQAVDFGESGNVPAGSITKIINPNPDIKSIEHTSIITYGTDTESDKNLRKRFSLAIAGAGSATAAAIRGSIMRVEGVKSAVVIENSTDETDKQGRPPHTFECYVNTDDITASMNENIAKAIFEKKPVGIRSIGKISVSIKDMSGNINTVCFTHIEKVYITVSFNIAVTDKFENDGIQKIKENLTEYINFLENGDDVIFSSFYSYIYSVTGVKEVSELNIDVKKVSSAEKNALKIFIPPSETAYLLEDDINIGVTAYEE